MNDILEMFGHEKEKTHLIIDLSGYAHTIYHGAIKNDEKLTDDESRFNHWRYLILSNIVEHIKNYKADNIFIACDGGSWREKEFIYYKAKRKEERLKNPELLKPMFQALNEFQNELSDIFKFGVLRGKGCEGDDWVAFLVHELPENDNKIIISGDKDMIQLTKVANTRFYNIRKKCETQCENPEIALQKLIIMGDTSDGIPNIKSDDDTFIIKEKRQKACGEKAVAKMFKEGFENILMENAIWRKNYKRNEKLITLDEKNIPVKIWQQMKDEFEALNYSNSNAIEIGRYFTNKDIIGLIPRVNDFIRS